MRNFILFFLLVAGFLVSAQTDSVLVCKSSGAYAYHSYTCYGLKRCKAEIAKTSLSIAKKKGYRACKICYKSNPSSKRRKKYPTNGRCHATTKKGTRCKRKSQSGRKYCWQH